MSFPLSLTIHNYLGSLWVFRGEDAHSYNRKEGSMKLGRSQGNTIFNVSRRRLITGLGAAGGLRRPQSDPGRTPRAQAVWDLRTPQSSKSGCPAGQYPRSVANYRFRW